MMDIETVPEILGIDFFSTCLISQEYLVYYYISYEVDQIRRF